jgi:hypothetical protein
LSKIENLTAAIHNANIEVHQIEARYYELIHVEIYSKYEQHRIDFDAEEYWATYRARCLVPILCVKVGW